MKKFLPFLLVLIPFIGLSQTPDSLIFQKVDSLMALSDSLRENRQPGEALRLAEESKNFLAQRDARRDTLYAGYLNKVAERFFRLREYEKAASLLLEISDIYKTVFGIDSKYYAECMANLGLMYKSMNRYEKAEFYYLKAKEIHEKVLGKEHSDYSIILNHLGNLYKSQGRYNKAEPFYLEAKEIREKISGNKHPDYTRILDNLANLYRVQGRYKEAEPLFLEAKEINEEIFSKQHLSYASGLNGLALLYEAQGRHKEAETLYLEAKEIKEKTLGNQHPSYATTLNNLANVYGSQGRHEEAEVLYLQVKEIREKIFGKEHPSYASSLGNLAFSYAAQGRYEEAEVLYLKAIEIEKKVLGKEHPKYALRINNLAGLYKEQGRYEKAEQLFREAKEIKEKVLGKEHPGYATTLENLAGLYSIQGLYEQAEPLFQEVKEIVEKVLGREHPNYARILNNLALLYHDLGRYEEAEQLYLKVKEIWGEILGKEHSSYAISLNNLACLYNDQHRYDQVELLFQEAIEVLEKVLGKEHPTYAVFLSNLAYLYKDQGRHEEAESLFQKTKQIREKVLGEDHPAYANSLQSLASLYEVQGRYEKAALLFRQANSIHRKLLSGAAKYMSEQELDAYIRPFRNKMAALFSFSLKSYPHYLNIISLSYDNTLLHKGFLLESVLGLRQAIQSSPDSVQTLFYKWKGLHRRLAKQYSKPLAEREGVEDLENRANDLEKELTRLVAGFEEARRQVSWEEVRDQLQPDEAAVEFVHFRYRDTTWTDSVMYCALILLPVYEYPRLVPLFEEGQLEGLFRIDSDNRQAQVTQLYAARDATRGGTLANKAQYPDLYRLVWQPLDSLLPGVEKVYYAPSGLLHRISFPAIRVDSSTFLSDRYQLQPTSSTRSLVVSARESTTSPRTVALFGDITYHTDSTALAEGRDTTQTTGTYIESIVAQEIVPEVDRGQSGTCHWSPLPGTRKELEGLLPLFSKKNISTQIYRQYQASEEAFKRIGEGAPSPDILHVATHGYFAPDPKQREEEEMSLSDKPAFRFSEQPLLRSGLILAGADTAWCTGVGLDSLEDGILTAYEISRMDLSNTRLAVLSACDTGLGDIKGSEGVYGLQRAFRMAGVDYLLLSLWPVADSEETIEFMETFYRHWLSGMPIRDAFDQTQRAMRAKYPEPYYWAGFVLID